MMYQVHWRHIIEVQELGMNLNACPLQPIEVQHIPNWVVNLSRLEWGAEPQCRHY